MIAADGVLMENWQQWVSYVKERPEQIITLTLERDSQTRYVDITPELVNENGSQFGRVGVYPVPPEWPPTMIRHIDYNGWQALVSGARETWDTSAFVLLSVKKIILGDISTKHLSGVITIAKVAGQQAKAGIIYYAGFLALLSVSLGVFNLLPIPVLDGGHLLFYLIEAIKCDIGVVQKEINRCMIVDITVPGDVTVDRKGKEKIEKYGNLCRELGGTNLKLLAP